MVADYKLKTDNELLIEQLADSDILDTLFDTLKLNYGRAILNCKPEEKMTREHIYNKGLILDEVKKELQNLLNNLELDEDD